MYHKHKKTIFFSKMFLLLNSTGQTKHIWPSFWAKFKKKTRKRISLENDCWNSKKEENKTSPEYNFTISGVLNSYLELVWQRYPIFFSFSLFSTFSNFCPNYILRPLLCPNDPFNPFFEYNISCPTGPMKEYFAQLSLYGWIDSLIMRLFCVSRIPSM